MMPALVCGLLLAQATQIESAEKHHRLGEEQFKLGHIKESIAEFDRAIAIDRRRAARSWQRGISLYYAGRYEDGRKQFELDQALNPNDVEESLWRYLCMARSSGVLAAREAMMSIKQDRRVPMMEIYELYQGTGSIKHVMAAAQAGNPTPQVLKERLFYAYLYIGLYYEASGDKKLARENINHALEHIVDDYMGDVARVHALLRR